MQLDDLANRFRSVTVWKSGEERAPHKPLLMLYALGKFLAGERKIDFKTSADELKDLLESFGPSRRAHRPEYPFVRLSNDGLWELCGDGHIDTRRDHSAKELAQRHVAGSFKGEILALLDKYRDEIPALARTLVEANFPETYQEEILDAVDIAPVDVPARNRDGRYRHSVLVAYGYQCAVCSFNLRLGNAPVGIEAAHIKWFQAGGPDTVDNGLALCSMHHKLFDRGVFTIDEQYALLVSDLANGSLGCEIALDRFHGSPIRLPADPAQRPRLEFMYWHRREVFRGSPRYVPKDGTLAVAEP